jgi:hypothetical protein
MTAHWYNPKAAYTLAKVDAMLQRIETTGWCDLTELHEFVKVFRTLPQKHQLRYAHLLDEAADFWDEGEQPWN